ncbi:hypothetical protein [Sediminitomix flava]|nr:hypothetical protein [Sediminitomix flava]
MNYEQRQELKNQLPHGALKDIGETNNLQYQNIVRFFNGYRSKEDAKIINAVVDYVEKWKEEQRQATERLIKVLQA